MSVPQLILGPVDALIDVPRTIRIEHLLPGAKATITATTERGNHTAWQSRISARADGQGIIDLGRQAPFDGTYSGISPMGLFWSQVPADSHDREVFPASVMDPLRTDIRVKAGDSELHGTLIQRLAAAGVSRTEVRDEGLVGTLFVPGSPGPHPAVIVLNGSGGGINEARGALYASHGYLAFSLAYFKAPGLSDYISNTPLEYFKKAMDWLRKTYRPYKNFVALSGQSRGGELVLLLASLFPDDVSAVVAYVPGAVIHSGQNAADPAVGREGPAWLLNGKELVHVWKDNKTATWAPFDEGPSPHRHALAVLTALQDSDAVARARIKVENIKGPVILLSGTDDGSWPSSLYSKMVVDKLHEAGFPYEVQWIDTQDAGHGIVFPYVPTTQLAYAHPVSKRLSTGGGRPDANALSDERTWSGVKAFLKRAVSSHKLAAN
jgi:fermentation-respiration switch protein FrsA (DUF1100 family)